MIVVDASVAVKWAIPEVGRENARRLLSFGHRLAAPDLIYAEVANVFRKRMKLGELTMSQADAAFTALGASIAKIIPSSVLAVQALKYAKQLDHSAYDCFYLAATEPNAFFVTADDVFARKCVGAGVLSGQVISLSEIDMIPIAREARF